MTIYALALVPATQITNADAAYYTTPANTTAVVKRAVFVNTTAAYHTLTVNAVPSGGSSSAGNTLISARTLAPGESYVSPELAGLTLPAGASLHALADANSAITMAVSGIQVN